jgi:hypothetical protein
MSSRYNIYIVRSFFDTLIYVQDKCFQFDNAVVGATPSTEYQCPQVGDIIESVSERG